MSLQYIQHKVAIIKTLHFFLCIVTYFFNYFIRNVSRSEGIVSPNALLLIDI